MYRPQTKCRELLTDSAYLNFDAPSMCSADYRWLVSPQDSGMLQTMLHTGFRSPKPTLTTMPLGS